MRSTGTPKSQCASRISRPLFIIVAESMVIFGPMRQRGWASASSTVTVLKSRAGSAPKGPPEAVRIRRRIVASIGRNRVSAPRTHRGCACAS